MIFKNFFIDPRLLNHTSQEDKKFKKKINDQKKNSNTNQRVFILKIIIKSLKTDKLKAN